MLSNIRAIKPDSFEADTSSDKQKYDIHRCIFLQVDASEWSGSEELVACPGRLCGHIRDFFQTACFRLLPIHHNSTEKILGSAHLKLINFLYISTPLWKKCYKKKLKTECVFKRDITFNVYNWAYGIFQYILKGHYGCISFFLFDGRLFPYWHFNNSDSAVMVIIGKADVTSPQKKNLFTSPLFL